jgi:hypothetical protein
VSGFLAWLQPADWKRGIALVILWTYAYQLVAWPLLFWGTTLLTMFTGNQWPAPPLLPWESLAAGTGTLGMVGGIQTWRENRASDSIAAGGTD